MTNVELVSRAQAGEEEAFSQIVLRYEQELATFLCRRVRDPHLAEDLLQDTFLAAWRSIRSTRPDLNVRPWLYKIALNAARQWERRQRIVRMVPFLHDQVAESEVPQGQDDVKNALAQMRRRDVDLLLLKTVAGFTYSEIAALLGMKPDAVRQRLHRARERFRVLFEGEKEARR